MRYIVSIEKEGEEIYKGILSAVMLIYRNNDSETTEILAKFPNPTDTLNIGAMFDSLMGQSIEKINEFINKEVDNTFHPADLELSVSVENQYLISGEKVSNILLLGFEVVKPTTIIPLIKLFNIDNYNSWSFVYAEARKHLAVYDDKLEEGVFPIDQSKEQRASTADEVTI